MNKKLPQLASISSLLPLAGASAAIDVYTATVYLNDSGDIWYLDGTSSSTAMFGKDDWGGAMSYLGYTSALAAEVGFSGGKVLNLTPGATVSSAAFNFVRSYLSAGYGGTQYAFAAWGDFTLDTPGYFGFRFDNGGTDNYGWAQIVRTQGVGDYDWAITQWAYDDSGASIQVGAVPEPSQAAKMLGLLALGAAGLARYRRSAA
jgi:hypothetical protein